MMLSFSTTPKSPLDQLNTRVCHKSKVEVGVGVGLAKYQILHIKRESYEKWWILINDVNIDVSTFSSRKIIICF